MRGVAVADVESLGGPRSERAKALVRQHYAEIDASWRRNMERDKDLVGLLRVDDDGWFLGMSGRQEKIDEAPEMLRYFPQLARAAWQASPRAIPGTAMWLLVGEPPFWTCLRVQRTRMVAGGQA